MLQKPSLHFYSENAPDYQAHQEGEGGYAQGNAGHFQETLFEGKILGYRKIKIEGRDDPNGYH